MSNEERILSALHSIEAHLESLVRMRFAEISQNMFADDAERQAFEMTGELSSAEICKKLRMSPNRLTDLRNRWLDAGLLQKVGNAFQKPV
jgi:hypothetical protein